MNNALYGRLLLLIGLAAVLAAPAQAQTSLNVAAAANLEKVFTTELIPRFERKTGINVVPVFGATKMLALQLENGAPFQVFVSADAATVDKLVGENKLDAASEHAYAVGQLVLWTKKDAPFQPRTVGDLVNPAVTAIAIANPKTAPYGTASIETLKSASLFDKLNSKIVYAENIQQSLQFAQSGNASVSFTALSLVIGQPGGSYFIVPATFHNPIVQKVAVTPNASPEARKFEAFLLSGDAAKIWKRYGYELPPASPSTGS